MLGARAQSPCKIGGLTAHIALGPAPSKTTAWNEPGFPSMAAARRGLADVRDETKGRGPELRGREGCGTVKEWR